MVMSENSNTITAELEILNLRIYKILFVVRHFSKYGLAGILYYMIMLQWNVITIH